MINKLIVAQWEKNKDEYRRIIRRAIIKKNFKYEYKFLVHCLITYVINKDLYVDEKDYTSPLIPLVEDIDQIVEVPLGQYNGAYIYILRPKDKWNCCVPEVWITKAFYGSCSGCDELLEAEINKNPEEAVDMVMKLSLDLIEEFRPLAEIYPV